MTAPDAEGVVRCCKCGRWAEATAPDGSGDQRHYCGFHMPE